MPRRPALHTRLARRLVGLAELLLLLLPACSQLPVGEDEAFGVVENADEERPMLPPTVRVMSWNVHGSAAARDDGHLRALAEVIRAAKADVVLLQEVHRGTRAGGGRDQFAELVEMTGMNGCFGKSFDLDDGAYGNAILSRAPLRSARTVRLPGSGEPRTVLRCESQWNEIEVPLLTTHLTAWDIAKRGPRSVQVASIAARLAAADEPLTILGGDFNAPQLAPEMRALREHSPVRSVAAERLVTYRSMGRSYDHVFVGSGWSAKDVAIVHDGPSDHWPVSATLRRVERHAAGVEASG